jgi:hypothetical protein
MGNIFLTESCVRSEFRITAQESTVSSIEDMTSKKYNSSQSLCMRVTSVSRAKKHVHFLRSFDEKTLKAEADIWRNKDSYAHKAIAPLVMDLITKAEYGLKLGPYSVMKKTGPLFEDQKDKRYYHSVRPYKPKKELAKKELADKVAADEAREIALASSLGKQVRPYVQSGFIYLDGMRVPGSIIGGPGEDRNDRSSAWYMVSNVTNLALAWHFTQDKRYADYATKMVDIFILSEVTGMHPSLMCAQEGHNQGLIDWKDFFFFLDAIVLLERSGSMSGAQVQKMEQWTSHMVEWYMTSHMGMEEGLEKNNHGLYFDLSTLALSVYSNGIDDIDDARTRIQFRLSKVWPDGHYAYDGTPSHELIRATCLHYATFNLLGWIHIGYISLGCAAISVALYYLCGYFSLLMPYWL